ncbi:MAG: ArsA-related P-loop ATPase, partial [Halobacteria archaeon]|nr:ArsA-related P-loop ATPase [Halobacteria archaeon]
PVRTLVINKVMEDINEDCEFCQSRWEVQRENIDEAEEMFRDLEVKHVPLFGEEVQGIEVLERVGERLDVGEPPTLVADEGDAVLSNVLHHAREVGATWATRNEWND